MRGPVNMAEGTRTGLSSVRDESEFWHFLRRSGAVPVGPPISDTGCRTVMIIFAFAVPGRFGEWCDALIARATERCLGAVVAISANSSDEVVGHLIRSEGSNFFVKGPRPEPWLHHILKSTEKPFTIVLDDPREAALDLIYRHELDMADAVRRVASSCASMMACVALPGALVLSSSRDWEHPLLTAQKIVRHYGLLLESAELERIVSELAMAGLCPSTDAPTWISAAETETVISVVSGAVTPYVDHFLGAPFGPITWANDLIVADGHVPATHAVDITGRVRALLYGPYITVPPGNWTAEIVLGFSQEATETNFLIDLLVAGKQISATNIQPMRQGVHSVNLSFVIDEANTHPLEFRVINEKPAFDGRVALGRITLTLHQDVPHLGGTLQEELGLSG
jgi:hypothetical protein